MLMCAQCPHATRPCCVVIRIPFTLCTSVPIVLEVGGSGTAGTITMGRAIIRTANVLAQCPPGPYPAGHNVNPKHITYCTFSSRVWCVVSERGDQHEQIQREGGCEYAHSDLRLLALGLNMRHVFSLQAFSELRNLGKQRCSLAPRPAHALCQQHVHAQDFILIHTIQGDGQPLRRNVGPQPRHEATYCRHWTVQLLKWKCQPLHCCLAGLEGHRALPPVHHQAHGRWGRHGHLLQRLGRLKRLPAAPPIRENPHHR
mmetsp:Transcript_13935/g.40821  ORF Transcript_13935/g.40821 Transcript_13935/m.40821 type:complete len:257 (+) Transcript_13935:163-933(+)